MNNYTFDSYMKLHYSQTISKLFSYLVGFDSYMKLHYSQTGLSVSSKYG